MSLTKRGGSEIGLTGGGGTADQPESGAEPPASIETEPPTSTGTPYTVFFPDEGGELRPADLEHPAALPRVGEIVEYLGDDGLRQRYVVAEVVHSLQLAAEGRPTVRDEPSMPAALSRDQRTPSDPESAGGALRAGLPRVILARVEESRNA
jgi:hypothetical protein